MKRLLSIMLIGFVFCQEGESQASAQVASAQFSGSAAHPVGTWWIPLEQY